ncbi:flagellin [Sulfurimonas autotrophica]|uniref:Flagellin n=1 Tax=Sulfurimonas autotrophica (strain ATCC BAA-671 / DSM 16294 / JCM 11897 / OK10) TaxID=563040 RepID=E0UT77_SULAO|nr:flagellin [Sulfurimonas autotrophica]ADN08180.1 flagellin domain protein [Sulfurimonas autotrophica DSM 16294]
MGFRINTNIAAMNAHRNSVNTNLGLDKSLNRLSSGLRINTAADDASGMTIADSLRSQAQGLGQAINNANDGVAITQTADGALDEYVKIINSVRTKAIQAASDGQNTDSRGAIQKDIDRLLEEANSIANTTQFNGQKLLDGTFSNKSFHIGAYAGETVNLSVGNVQTDSVGDIKSTTGSETRAALDSTNLAEGASGQALKAGELKINDTDISSTINSLSPTKLTDAASVAAAITNATDLVAEGHNSLTAAAAVSAGTIDSTNFLKINGVAIADTTVVANDSNGALVRAINDISDQTGVTASLNTENKLVLESNDGSNISIATRDNDVDTVTFTASTGGGDVSVTNANGFSVTYAASSGDTATAIAAAITTLINASSDFGAVATDTADSGTLSIEQSVLQGAQTITVAEANADGAGVTTTDGTNEASTTYTGLTADNETNGSGAITATINSTATAAVVIEAGQLVINGVDLAGTYGDGSTAGSARSDLQSAIKDIDGMSQSYIAKDGKMELSVNNGDDLNIAGTTANSTYGLTKGVTNQSKMGSVEIYSDSAVKVGGNDPDSFGFTSGTKNVIAQGASLESIDVTSRNSAEVGILITDSALKQLDGTRSDLGSVQNQLESTIRNISVTQVNVTAAESQIRDVDFAAESANFAKLNILAQSGSYAMSQANAVQQNVMRLLQ